MVKSRIQTVHIKGKNTDKLQNTDLKAYDNVFVKLTFI